MQSTPFTSNISIVAPIDGVTIDGIKEDEKKMLKHLETIVVTSDEQQCLDFYNKFYKGRYSDRASLIDTTLSRQDTKFWTDMDSKVARLKELSCELPSRNIIVIVAPEVMNGLATLLRYGKLDKVLNDSPFLFDEFTLKNFRLTIGNGFIESISMNVR